MGRLFFDAGAGPIDCDVMAALFTSPLVNENHFGLHCNDDALWPCLKSISPRQTGAGTADACAAFLLVTRKRQ
jgi:hypothetical protein